MLWLLGLSQTAPAEELSGHEVRENEVDRKDATVAKDYASIGRELRTEPTPTDVLAN